MNRAFTLIELLLVVAVLGIMGTVTLGGYHAFERGMAERGAMVNANFFLKQCWQRAQIDRQPIYVYCWNELLTEEDEKTGEGATVVGRAIAIRQAGRISAIDRGEGLLFDEFGDLRFNSLEIMMDAYGSAASKPMEMSSTKGNEMWLYCLHGKSDVPKRTLISQFTEKRTFNEVDPSSGTEERIIPIESYAYRCVNSGDAAQWKPGYAYGLEFSTITLPHGFTFGSRLPKTLNDAEVFADSLRYEPGKSASKHLQVFHLRLNSAGEFDPVKIGTTDPPNQD